MALYPPKRKRPVEMRLYYMIGAFLTWDKSIFTYSQGMGIPTEVPTPIFLIDHPEGKVLFETGLHKNIATEKCEEHWGFRAREWKPRMKPEQYVVNQLKTLGVNPDEIRYVVLSCLLSDHAGGMEAFPNATFVLQLKELQEAWWPDKRVLSDYHFADILPTRNFKFWELDDEDLDLYGDGSIEILSTPHHTRGEQTMVVRLPNTGTVVLPAGVISWKENLDKWVMTGTPAVDPRLAHRSMEKLKRIIDREQALIIHDHDPYQWKSLKLAPEYYS